MSPNPAHTPNKRNPKGLFGSVLPDADSVMLLKNQFLSWCSSGTAAAKPADARPRVQHDVPASFDKAADNLMLTVQSRAMAEARSLMANIEQPDNQGFLGISYAEHLAICVVHDKADSKLYLTAADVAKWGVPAAEVFRVAFENLNTLPCEFHGHFPDGRVLWSAADDSYDSARLLLGIFDQLPVKGRPVVMVLHPNVLMVTGDDDPEGLNIVLKRAQEFRNDPLTIGPLSFRQAQFGWEPWIPQYSPEDRLDFERLMLDMRERDYSRQQQVLTDYEQTKSKSDQRFIASYMRQRKDRVAGVRTLCVWTKGIPSLLPKTDAIAFVDGTTKGAAPWSLVAAEMKDELEPTGLYPERYAVCSFPTDAQICKLVEEAARRGFSLDRLR